jgi:hypothetical protein
MPFNKFFDQSYGGDRCDKPTGKQQPFGAAAVQNRNNDPHHAYPDGDQQHAIDDRDDLSHQCPQSSFLRYHSGNGAELVPLCGA